ncbi:hypothetical protein GVN24_32335 [Rhizobium sp. CRIBSB]|nr:hypothetical protein [Rhizobium sp. CRIBSB]
MRITLLSVAVLSLAGAAQAQDRDNARLQGGETSHWTFEFGGGSDNRSKGTSKSANAPYVFGEAQWNAVGGFYADVEFETIDASGSRLEAEAEAGWQFSLAGLQFDASASRKWRVDADPGQDDATWEFQFDLERDIGPADARLRIEHSPDGLGSTRATTWVEGRVRLPVTDRLNLSGTLGRREQDNGVDYTGWNAGVIYTVSDRIRLDLRWHDTDVHTGGETFEGAWVASVLAGF